MNIGIIGGGVWGSAIAKLLSNNKVCIIARDSKIVTSINEHRFNPRLKYAVFNENVTATADLNEANNMDYLFVTLPCILIFIFLHLCLLNHFLVKDCLQFFLLQLQSIFRIIRVPFFLS